MGWGGKYFQGGMEKFSLGWHDSIFLHLIKLEQQACASQSLTHYHPAGTSKDSDICDFSKVSDIENSMVVNCFIYGFSPITYIITHMTMHFLTLLSMGQKSINIWIILIGSINVST